MGDSEQEQQNSLLAEILEQAKQQTEILTGNKNREQNQDLIQLEQTKEQQNTFKSIANNVAAQASGGRKAKRMGGKAGSRGSSGGGGGFISNVAGDLALAALVSQRGAGEVVSDLGKNIKSIASTSKKSIENIIFGKPGPLKKGEQREINFPKGVGDIFDKINENMLKLVGFAKKQEGNDLNKAEEEDELKRTLERIASKDKDIPGPSGDPNDPKKGGGFLGGIMGFLKDGLIAIAGGVTAFGAFIKPLLTRLAAFGKVISKVFMGLSKAFLPLTVALGVVGAIFGGIKGFKEDGFVGLVNGIISGVFDAIVGGVVAALGSLGTTLLKAFGLDKTARAFQQTLNSLFETVRATIMAPVLLLKGLFTGDFELIKETIGNLINMLREGILNSFKFVLAAVMEIPVLLLGAIKALGVGLLKVIGGIGIALFNALKVIFLDLPLFIGDAIISGLSSLFSLFGKLPGAIAAGIGALLPGGKSPGEAFMAALTSGGEGEEEKPEKKSQRRTKRTKTAVEKVVATQEERDFTMAAESFDRSEANLKAFESEAGGDFTIKEKLQEGGDPADPTDYVKEKVYNDPKKQKQFERLKEVRDKALRKKSELGGGLVKAFKEKFGKGLRGRTIADSELSQMGGQEGFLEKIQNRTGAKMQQEQAESMERSAAAQAFRDRQGERTDRGRVINAPTKNNVVNTTINEAPKHVDRTTQLFGALPPGMAY